MAEYGFIGLGNMGAPMAANLVKAGFPLTVYDLAGTRERAPEGTAAVAGVAQEAETVFLSLPSGKEVAKVAQAIVAAPDRRTATIVDFSTTGPQAAEAVAAELDAAGIAFLDAPVSGGKSGAVAGTLAVMCGGPTEAFESLKPALESVGANVFHVGERAGQGQAMKCLNNFLAATCLTATCEALQFGGTYGLDFRTMLDVLNQSSGKSSATMGRLMEFVERRDFNAGFATALMAKDVGLFLDHAIRAGTSHAVGDTIAALWREADAAMPGSDFTAIWKHLEGKRA